MQDRSCLRWFELSCLADTAGRRGGAEPVINVDDRYTSSTGVEHPKERSQPTEGGTVPNAGRDGDDRHPHYPPDYARQGAFHARHHDHRPGTLELIVRSEQAVEARHSDIDETVDWMAERVGHDSSLLRYGQIAGSGGYHQDRPGAPRWPLSGQMHHTSHRMPGQRRKAGLEPVRDGWVGTGPEECARSRLQAFADGDDLVGRLAFAENDFGKTLAQSSVMIDPRERQIFKREVSQPVECCCGRQAAGRHFGEQDLELLGGHATWATGSRYSRKIASASAMDSIWNRRWRSALEP